MTDCVTPSMENAIRETERRRELQIKYNEEHGIIPKTVTKKVAEILEIFSPIKKKEKKRKRKNLLRRNAS